MNRTAYLTITQAAKHLGLDRQSIQAAIGKGWLKATRLGPGCQWLIKLADLEAVLEANQTFSPEELRRKRKRRRKVKHVERLT